ncbi:MAG TPA: hypothetical protein VFE71_12000 [Bacteroidales bacterium]|nr:hypothetical protein [Bacteroidales bacterium]
MDESNSETRNTRKVKENEKHQIGNLYNIIVQPPRCNELFSEDKTFLALLRDKSHITGIYQFGVDNFDSAFIENLKNSTRDRGYIVVCVAGWSDHTIFCNSLQITDLLKQPYPGGKVIEIVSTFWLSKCKTKVLLPKTKGILSDEFLKEHWLPETSWAEYSIRPPPGSRHLFIRDGESFKTKLIYHNISRE